jgi:hypothetical protein
MANAVRICRTQVLAPVEKYRARQCLPGHGQAATVTKLLAVQLGLQIHYRKGVSLLPQKKLKCTVYVKSK